MEKNLKSFSKFLSFILRHNPDHIGLQLDANGWADVNDLLAKANAVNVPLSRELLQEIVATNPKKRFAFNESGDRIRASQGHSVNIDLELKPVKPPGFLYHGTADRFADAIRQKGLLPMSRQHVHLSADVTTALQVGARHGKPFIFTVNSGEMAEHGYLFYISENGVWLTAQVPPVYLKGLV